MSDQPEALRLADDLERAVRQTDADDDVIDVARWYVEDSATELRRLHGEIEQLKAERDALLEALEDILSVPQFVDAATVPIGGIEAAPQHVVLNFSISLLRVRRAKAAIDAARGDK